MINKDARKLSRFFLAGATTCEIDKQGRILLPAVLREFAGLDKDIVLAGVLERVEIWSKEKWHDSTDYDDVDEVAEHMSEFGFLI